MINPKELRIGNLIETTNKIVRVIQTSKDTIWIQDLNRNALPALMPQWFSGIPITEEWLIKFGYKTIYDDFMFIRGEFTIMKENGIYGVHKTNRTYITYCDNIKSIHQLQNFTYILTGEELTINE